MEDKHTLIRYITIRMYSNLMHLFFKWANPGLFLVYFRPFQTNVTIFTTNKCEKISIQYTVPGFEPTTFGMWDPPNFMHLFVKLFNWLYPTEELFCVPKRKPQKWGRRYKRSLRLCSGGLWLVLMYAFGIPLEAVSNFEMGSLSREMKTAPR